MCLTRLYTSGVGCGDEEIQRRKQQVVDIGIGTTKGAIKSLKMNRRLFQMDGIVFKNNSN